MKKTRTLTDRLAVIAEGMIGMHEEPRGSNTGAQLVPIFAADDYKPNKADNGYPWCASAVCFAVQQFLKTPEGEPFSRMQPPRTAAAFGLLKWGAKQGCLVIPRGNCKVGGYWPQRGDIVVFTFSHCGIVLAAGSPDTHFTDAEGNTDSNGSRDGWEFCKRARTFSSVEGFIRLTPRATALEASK